MKTLIILTILTLSSAHAGKYIVDCKPSDRGPQLFITLEVNFCGSTYCPDPTKFGWGKIIVEGERRLTQKDILLKRNFDSSGRPYYSIREKSNRDEIMRAFVYEFKHGQTFLATTAYRRLGCIVENINL